jgi:hypothetical protein
MLEMPVDLPDLLIIAAFLGSMALYVWLLKAREMKVRYAALIGGGLLSLSITLAYAATVEMRSVSLLRLLILRAWNLYTFPWSRAVSALLPESYGIISIGEIFPYHLLGILVGTFLNSFIVLGLLGLLIRKRGGRIPRRRG